MNNRNNNLIFGRNPVKEALRAKKVKSLFLAEGFSHLEINELINQSHLPVNYVSNKELDKMCPGVHQGIAAIIKDFEYYSFDDVINIAKKQEHPLIVILDGINDTHNLGAILRSCDVFNVAGVLMNKHHQVPLNATVAKTSAGAINYVPVALVNNLNQAIKRLKDEGFWIVATDGSGTTNYQDLKYDFSVGLIVGSEGEGVSKLVLSNSDYIVRIPQYGHVNSLNASVAAAILLAKIRE